MALTRDEAESALQDLAAVFLRSPGDASQLPPPNADDKYRTLVEQLPAVVFMAYLDRGIGEAYVSPRIEEILGFTQAEWLEDPVRWYNQVHPDDQQRWSIEAAEMFLTGHPLRSAYRVIARDGRVIWFQCEAKMIRRDNGRPWFIHGVAFDISELKRTEQTLQEHIAERQRMEQAILEIGTTVQRQIAQDLHDGLGQHLTGIAFMSKVLEQKLADSKLAEATDAAKIVTLVNEAIHKTRELSRGLLPVVSGADGLISALARWAAEIEDLFHIPCEFQCADGAQVTDVRIATQLYHIAQEAVTNAIRHAKPTRLTVSLAPGLLVVQDDGIGVGDAPSRPTGLGMQIMRYRADMIGGSLDVRRATPGGTMVSCHFKS
ncbi:MAG TPA: PAS domain-containing protein [Gemmatimonadaceae bacterium]|jgi:PAS domain S-box-containing protein|nr:PAS domain-containing protein [Gemmatimonadaceae bacterium]